MIPGESLHPVRLRRTAGGTALALALALSATGASASIPAVSHAKAVTVFVAPTGYAHGRGRGTERSPYASLGVARDAIRGRLAHMRSDVVVTLGAGTYFLDHPLEFTAADSGRNGHTVRYAARPGTHPVVSGGTPIRGWRQTNPAKGIWTATVDPGLNTRQLYVDDVRATVATGPAPITLTQTATGYIAGSTTMASWSNPRDIEFVYPSGPSNWTESRCRVASIVGTIVTMQQPCWENTANRSIPGSAVTIGKFDGPLKVAPVVTNARELLTRPGQWYLDRRRHEISYIPMSGQDMAHTSAVAPRLQVLVDGVGTPRHPVHDLAFQGITFSHAGWIAPSAPTGYSDFQAGAFMQRANSNRARGSCAPTGGPCFFSELAQVPGNVRFRNDRNISFRDDTFTHLGAIGLALGDGSQRAVVTGNQFTDTSCSGLNVGGIDHPQAPRNARTAAIEIANNWFHATSVEYQSCAALLVGYAQHTTIRNNQINDVPYSGISIGWGGWLERFRGRGPLPNYSSNNVVANNLIFDEMKVIVDGGGIYTNGIEGTSLATGEKVENNIVLEQHNLTWAIYTDNGAMYVTVRNNAVWDALDVAAVSAIFPGASPQFSFGGCGGGPITYDGNYSIQPDPAGGLIAAQLACGGHPLDHVTVLSNHVITAQDQIPAALVSAAGLQPRAYARLTPTPMPTNLAPSA